MLEDWFNFALVDWRNRLVLTALTLIDLVDKPTDIPSRFFERCIRDRVETECRSVSRPVYTGATWITDAPVCETQAAIDRARSDGILAVEMGAAVLCSCQSDCRPS
jgi:hypothetical protein